MENILSSDSENEQQININYKTEEYDWLPICNKEGIICFFNKKNGQTQWTFPKIYNHKTKRYETI
jgi:hypothetical protein